MRSGEQASLLFTSPVVTMVLVDLKLFKNSIPFVYERKIGVCSRFFTIDLSDDSKWKITPWWTILETKNVIWWFYLHVVVCWSKEKALKSVRGRILFEIFHAFGEQCKSYFFSWRHQAPYCRWVRWFMGRMFYAFFSSGKLASCDLHFTGVRKTTWFHTRLSFLCQNTILNARHRLIGMSKDLLDYPFCHDVNKYERMVKIGQGTFGFVDCFSPPFW